MWSHTSTSPRSRSITTHVSDHIVYVCRWCVRVGVFVWQHMGPAARLCANRVNNNLFSEHGRLHSQLPRRRRQTPKNSHQPSCQPIDKRRRGPRTSKPNEDDVITTHRRLVAEANPQSKANNDDDNVPDTQIGCRLIDRFRFFRGTECKRQFGLHRSGHPTCIPSQQISH